MKKILVAIMACAFLVGLNRMGYCQGESSDDTAIEQSESQMNQGLDSEISGDRSQGESEVGQVESSMSTGGGGN